METQLEKHDIIPYLAYGLQVQVSPQNGIWEVTGINNDCAHLKGSQYMCDISDCRPLLLPLDKLSSDQWETYNKIDENNYGETSFAPLVHHVKKAEYLFSIHADVHNLIERGLALDKTLQS